MDNNNDEKIKVCFIGYGMSADVQLALVKVAKELRDAGFSLVEAIKGLQQILLVGDEPIIRSNRLQQALTCRRDIIMGEVELFLIPKNYGPETRIRPSNSVSHIRPSNSVSHIRPSNFRSHIRPLRMLDSRSGMKGKTIRKRLGK